MLTGSVLAIAVVAPFERPLVVLGWPSQTLTTIEGVVLAALPAAAPVAPVAGGTPDSGSGRTSDVSGTGRTDVVSGFSRTADVSGFRLRAKRFGGLAVALAEAVSRTDEARDADRV